MVPASLTDHYDWEAMNIDKVGVSHDSYNYVKPFYYDDPPYKLAEMESRHVLSKSVDNEPSSYKVESIAPPVDEKIPELEFPFESETNSTVSDGAIAELLRDDAFEASVDDDWELSTELGELLDVPEMESEAGLLLQSLFDSSDSE